MALNTKTLMTEKLFAGTLCRKNGTVFYSYIGYIRLYKPEINFLPLVIYLISRKPRSIITKTILQGTVQYENTPMQYTAIFHGCKNVHFHKKICNIFLIFAQNIDFGYTLEPPLEVFKIGLLKSLMLTKVFHFFKYG